MRSGLWWTATVMETGFWVGAGLALYHGEPLLASLALSFLFLRVDGVRLPVEVAFWVLGAALIRAYSSGEMAVFALLVPSAISRLLYLLILVQNRRRPGLQWGRYVFGPVLYPGWSAAIYRWRQSGKVVHRVGWTLVCAEGVAWTAGILWWAIAWDSWWRWPYVVVLSTFAAWWCGLALHAFHRSVHPYEDEVPGSEAPGSPNDWGSLATRLWAEPTSWGANDLPPAVLDFHEGFDGARDPRLRLFAADCAEHVLPSEQEAGRKPHAHVSFSIEQARRRARGELRGWLLKVAFDAARSTLTRTARRRSWKRGDPATLRLVEDGASAACHAVCAPTPREAAVHAANSASVTVDGALREDEHRWQLARLAWYRAHPSDPA